MTRTHGGPLIIPAEKWPHPVGPCVIKHSPSCGRGGRPRDGEITDFIYAHRVSLADHVGGLFTLRGRGMAPGELTPDHTRGCFIRHFAFLSLQRWIYIESPQKFSCGGHQNRPDLSAFYTIFAIDYEFSYEFWALTVHPLIVLHSSWEEKRIYPPTVHVYILDQNFSKFYPQLQFTLDSVHFVGVRIT